MNQDEHITIAIGRTGNGKTTLLSQLAEERSYKVIREWKGQRQMKARICTWFKGTHGCDRTYGHANKHRCECGEEWQRGAEYEFEIV